MNAQLQASCTAALFIWSAMWHLTAVRADEEYTIKYAEIEPAGDGKVTVQLKKKTVTLDELPKELKDPHERVRLDALLAISWPEKWPKDDSKVLIRALAERLKDRDRRIRYHAAEALALVGPDAVLALNELMEAAKDERALTRNEALRAVSQMGAKAKSAIPGLIKALEDEEEAVAGTAALALGNIGPDAVPALIKSLKSTKSQVRDEAAYALTIIGPEAKEALPALKQLLKDPSREVTRSVQQAIGEIEQIPGRPDIRFPGKIERRPEKPK